MSIPSIWITACGATSWASLAVRDFWGTTKKNSFLPAFNQEGISNTRQTKTQLLTLLPVAAHYCPLLSIVAHCCPFCCPSLAARPTNRGERRPLQSLSKIKKNIESERNIVNQEELKKETYLCCPAPPEPDQPTNDQWEREAASRWHLLSNTSLSTINLPHWGSTRPLSVPFLICTSGKVNLTAKHSRLVWST